MASAQELNAMAKEFGSVIIEEDVLTGEYMIRCPACGCKIGGWARESIFDIPYEALPDFVQMAVESALENHVCVRQVMDIAKHTTFSVSDVSKSLSMMMSAGVSAAEALRNFGESMHRLDAISVPRPAFVGNRDAVDTSMTSPADAMMYGFDHAALGVSRTVVSQKCAKCGRVLEAGSLFYQMCRGMSGMYCRKCSAEIARQRKEAEDQAKRRKGIRVIRFSGEKDD